MKNGTLNHLKAKRLMWRLKRPLYHIAGILESLWYLTTESADEGDIGRFTNADIAMAIGWEDDPDVLISALVETGWLDEHQSHRLVVHDWLDHAPDYVKERVRKRKMRAYKSTSVVPEQSGQPGTATGQPGTEVGQLGTITGHVPASSDFVPPIPSQSQPNQLQSIEEHEPPSTVTISPEIRVKTSSIRRKQPTRDTNAFTPPTVDEVREYCTEIRTVIDPQQFVDYYTSNGWMVGRTKMKDWRASVRNWAKRDFNLPNGRLQATSDKARRFLERGTAS